MKVLKNVSGTNLFSYIKKLSLFFTSILILTFFFISSTHKYYHSHCVLELNHKTGNAEAVIEVFFHDLEVSISKNSAKQVKVADEDFSQHLKSYLDSFFVLRDSTLKVINFQLVGQELKNEVMNIYLEFEKVNNWKGMFLENTLLIKEFPEQVNQVNLKSGAKKNSMVFTSKVINLQLR